MTPRQLRVPQLAVCALALGAILLVLTQRPGTAGANHAWRHQQGVGYDAIGPSFGWVNVYVDQSLTTRYTQALTAIDSWRALRYGDIWWLRYTNYIPESQAEVIDRDTATIFSGDDGAIHLYICNSYFPAYPGAFATTIVTDINHQPRGVINDANDLTHTGFFQIVDNVPFQYSSVCLNTSQVNNVGTIAHELGHVLGLDHPQFSYTVLNASGTPVPVLGDCNNTNRRTIMAYNYLHWETQWPSTSTAVPGDRGPTAEDLGGPWVCDGNFAGGLAYVYGLPNGGFGALSVTDTPTPTPTRTPPPPPTATPTPVDIDGDGFLNPQSFTHQGPANKDTTTDNCPNVFNPAQTNTDGNFIDLHVVGKTYDDITVANSDAYGDACDADIDNDGLTNVHELALGPGGQYHNNVCPGATANNTPPEKIDTDGDRALDGAECALGTDPADAASFPPASPAGDSDHDGLTDAFELTIGTDPNKPDSDGDLILDGVEFRYYNTNPLFTNGDGDACGDGKEIGSLNGDTKVDSTDLLIIAQASGNAPGPPYVTDFDLNKDSHINSTDLLIDAKLAGNFCP